MSIITPKYATSVSKLGTILLVIRGMYIDIANQIVWEEETRDDNEYLIIHTLRSNVYEILVLKFDFQKLK